MGGIVNRTIAVSVFLLFLLLAGLLVSPVNLNVPNALPAAASAPQPGEVGAPISIDDREAMAAIANKVWPIWAAVSTASQSAKQELREAGSDTTASVAIIDRAASAIEHQVLFAQSLVAPDVPHAQSMVENVRQGVPLFYDALKRTSRGLVSGDDAATQEASRDQTVAAVLLNQAHRELQAGAELQGLYYEGKWRSPPQERLNTERFEWETPVSIGVPCSPSAADVSFTRFTGDADGTATSEGSIRNQCSYPLNAIIDVFAAASKGGPVIMDGESIFVKDLPPGGVRSVTATVPNAISAAWFTWKLTEVSLEEPACPAGERCYYLDPWLSSAVEELKGVTDGEWLLKTAEERRVRIRRGDTAPGNLGQYESRTRTITMSTKLDDYSSWVRASFLAHELQHAAEHGRGPWVPTTEACFQAEDSAFRRMARTWGDLWPERLPLVGDNIHWQLNEVNSTVERDPNRFTSTLSERYKMLCRR